MQCNRGTSSDPKASTTVGDDLSSIRLESASESDTRFTSNNESMSLEQQLQLAIAKSMDVSSIPVVKSSCHRISMIAMIKKEMSFFEGGGTRGKYLQVTY